MALNYIWIAFFLIGFIVALGQLIFAGNTQIFNELVNSVFLNAKTGFEISLGLTGALTLWMGLLADLAGFTTAIFVAYLFLLNTFL